RVTAPQLNDPAFGLSLPWAEVVLSPATPTTAQLLLPDQGQVTRFGQSYDLGLSEPHAKIRLAPLKRLAPDHLDLMADAVTLDGQTVISGLDLEVQMARLGATAPLIARSAYDAHIDLGAVQTQTLAKAGFDLGPIPDPVTVHGAMRLWLDGTPSVTGKAAPTIVGWESDGLTLGAATMSMRVVGRVVRGANGLAEGQIAIYTTDAQQIIDQAADLGLIPAASRMLLRAGLGQLSKAAIDADLPGPVFPEAANGQIRLPVQMRDGQIFLGGIAIGAAPPFGAI
ncbi:MAG: DUF2125 domain-containing protein, partial [Paracoccus sp. (in: a-proteobacteria)]|nr:DUF2125 domain-containing protein [Paracoccus sp. (in: a-proteobacteria)]